MVAGGQQDQLRGQEQEEDGRGQDARVFQTYDTRIGNTRAVQPQAAQVVIDCELGGQQAERMLPTSICFAKGSSALSRQSTMSTQHTP